MTVVGLGAIGAEIARIAAAIGLNVIGVRRSPYRDGDPVTEVLPPSRLLEVAPRTDWLVLACPLTEETQGLCQPRSPRRPPERRARPQHRSRRSRR